MTAPHADSLVEGYLARLRAAAPDLTPGVREELVGDVRAHIAEARSREAEETDATILNILDRLGEPEELVAEARQRLSLAVPSPPSPGVSQRPALWDLAAIGLLPFIWPLGVVLLWYSPAWNGRDKLIGTVLPLGGYPWILIVPTWLQALGAGTPFEIIARLVGFAAMVLPLATAGYLSFRLSVSRRAATQGGVVARG